MKVNVFEEASNILNDFIINKIKNYSTFRNYDYDLNDPKKAVSGLSPFISRGIINEKFVLSNIKKSRAYSEKFVQEILWRTYWKGWLETHKYVWENYKESLSKESISITKSTHYDFYIKAINGKTKLEPFDYWVNKLKSTGYLHNHARMWFSSIWIHYFALPWELGAKFFYDNLLDADIASNTLSWRWVAGLQTIGKKYIATKNNINKYTFDRFNDFVLPNVKNISLEEKKHIVTELDLDYNQRIDENKNNIIFVFEENFSFDFIKSNKRKIELVVLLKIKSSSSCKSLVRQKFIKRCKNDFLELCKKNNIKVKGFDISKGFTDLLSFTASKNIKKIYSEYITQSYEKDILLELKKLLKRDNITYSEVLDDFYKDAWIYCNKGFFNFKKNFNGFLVKI